MKTDDKVLMMNWLGDINPPVKFGKCCMLFSKILRDFSSMLKVRFGSISDDQCTNFVNDDLRPFKSVKY